MARVRGLAMGIRADSSQLPQDLGRARGHWRRYGTDVEAINRSAATKVTEGLGRMRAALAGVGVALGAGAAIGGFVRLADGGRELVGTLDAIVKSSRNVGTSVETFQELRFAFEQSGVSAQRFEIGLTTLNRRTDEAAEGSKLAADAFARLGLDVERVLRLDTEERLKVVVEALRGVENAAERTRLAQELLGRTGRILGSVIEGGAAGIEEFQRRARETGIVVEGLDERIEFLNDQLSRNEQLLESSRQQEFVNTVNLSAEAAREAERAYKAWGDVLGRAEANALNLKTAVGGLIADLDEGESALARFIANTLGGGLGDQNVPVIPGQGIGRPRQPVQEPGFPRRQTSNIDADLAEAIIASVRAQRQFFADLEARRGPRQDFDPVVATGAGRDLNAFAVERTLEALERQARRRLETERRAARETARLNREREQESERYLATLEADNDNYIAALADTEQFIRSGRTGEQIREAGRELVREFEEGVREAAREAEEAAEAERERYVSIGRALDEGVRQGLLTAIRDGELDDVGDALVRKIEESALDAALDGLGLDGFFEDIFSDMADQIQAAAGDKLGPGSGLAGAFRSLFDGLFGGGSVFSRPGFGGLSNFGGFFQDGGFVPGPVGAARTIVAHGGELVLTPEQQRALTPAPAGSVTVQLYATGDVTDATIQALRTMGDEIADIVNSRNRLTGQDAA